MVPLKVSQNFLTSTKLIRQLIDKSSIGPSGDVIEIGPGKGHIIRQLAGRCGRLTAVEADGNLCRKRKMLLYG